MKSIKIATLLFVTTMAPSAFALVEVEVGSGQKTVGVTYDGATEKGKTKKLGGTELFANLLVDPIPLVPVSFGLAVQQYSYDESKIYKEVFDERAPGFSSDAKVKTAGVAYGPTLKIWAPLPYVKPYAKYTYLMGTEVTKIDVSLSNPDDATSGYSALGKTTAQHTGSDIQLGLGFSPIKLVGIFVEYAIHNGKSKTTDQSVTTIETSNGEISTTDYKKDDLTDDDKKSRKANATSIRFGISAGI